MTFTAGNLFPSHSCIGWPKSSPHWDSNLGPQLERQMTYQLSYPSPLLYNMSMPNKSINKHAGNSISSIVFVFSCFQLNSLNLFLKTQTYLLPFRWTILYFYFILMENYFLYICDTESVLLSRFMVIFRQPSECVDLYYEIPELDLRQMSPMWLSYWWNVLLMT